MSQTATIQVKIDPQTKISVTQLFESMGLTLPDAIKLFLKQSLNNNRLPFEVLPSNNYFNELEREEIAQSIRNAKVGKVKRFSTKTQIKDYLKSL